MCGNEALADEFAENVRTDDRCDGGVEPELLQVYGHSARHAAGHEVDGAFPIGVLDVFLIAECLDVDRGGPDTENLVHTLILFASWGLYTVLLQLAILSAPRYDDFQQGC